MILFFAVSCAGSLSIEYVPRPEGTDQADLALERGGFLFSIASATFESENQPEPPRGGTGQTEIAVMPAKIVASDTPLPPNRVNAPSTPLPTDTPEPPPATPSRTARPLPTARTTPTPLPEKIVYAADPTLGPNFGCFGYGLTPTGGLGMSCLDGDGRWVTYAEIDFSESGYDIIKSMIPCGEEAVLINDSPTVTRFDGVEWTQHRFFRSSPLYGFSEMACDSQGRMWIAKVDGTLGYYDRDEETWTVVPAPELARPENAFVQQIGIDGNDQLWLITGQDVAMYDGRSWTIYGDEVLAEVIGGKFITFDNLLFDANQNPVVLGSARYLRFDGDDWQLVEIEPRGLFRVRGGWIDGLNKAWLADMDEGLVQLDLATGLFTPFTPENSGFSHQSGRSLAVDGQGRYWVGTNWGINVWDGVDWRAFHMANSPLTDNIVSSIAVLGTGPQLPEPAPQGEGSLSGRLMLGDGPAAEVALEICQADLWRFEGSRCADQPLFMSTQSDDNGLFLFQDIPRGRYHLYIQIDGEWEAYQDGENWERFLVDPEKETDLGEIDLEMVAE